MRTSAAGSSHFMSRGFTLLELLVVVAIIAIATAGVSFALRDSEATQLEREAQRLAALLESARAQSRSSGVPVRWYATPESGPPSPCGPRISTTTPEFAKGLFRLLGLQPFVTISPGAVAHGATMPPGHMQNVYTPSPSTCATSE